MSSRPASLFVADQYVSSPSIILPPPPPPPRSGEGPRPVSLRRDNVVPLPSLTTNLPPHTAHPLLRTPLSSTSLSSPFTYSQLGPHSASPAAMSRGASPMALQSAYSVPYNPSEWSSGNRRPSQNEQRSGVHAEDGLPAPPPPYSPPRSQRTSSATESTAFSSAETTFSLEAQTSPPMSALSNIASSMSGATSLRDSGTSFSSNDAASPMHLPPPPPRNQAVDTRRSALMNRSRPMSVSSLSQVMTLSSQHGHAQPRQEPQPSSMAPQPPNAKRAASTGDVASVPAGGLRFPGCDLSNTRPSSRNAGWHPGMTLPGPPPGLPPASSRSSSASKATDDARGISPGPSLRASAYRIPLKAPMLSPMPPTPAGWSEDTPPRHVTRAAVPLHINTNLGQVSGQRDVHPLTEPVPDGSPAVLGLARSAAVRDSSAKGLRERRNLRRSIHDSEAHHPLVVATNPWAEAMNSAASTTKSPTMFSDTTGPNDSQMTSPVLERSSSGAEKRGFVASPYQELGLSPMSPFGKPGRTFHSGNPHSQVKALPTPPLSQKAPASAKSFQHPSNVSSIEVNGDSEDTFAAASLQRHREFLAREASAKSDADRLQIFADYLVSESVLRQKKYAIAISDSNATLDAIRNRLFDESDPAAQTPIQSQFLLENSGPTSSSDVPESATRTESGWYRDYRPALSPIASISHDGISSRGRTSSRWWESQGGSQTDEAGPQKIRRSKRESKYMGLSTNLIGSSIEERNTPTYPEFPQQLSAEQYPEEKAHPESFGIYDEAEPQHLSENGNIESNLLDVSRFITLPPPYPRHYPAVNNSHPDLASYRLTVRSLSDLDEVKSRKSRHAASVEGLRNGHKQKLTNVRQEFKSNVQAQIAEGTISYAEAAEAEEALRQEELQQEKETLQAEFDTLQDVVIKPLHELLNDRLVQLSSNIRDLTEKLHLEAQLVNPDRPQQEGDDTPELLEYLTQLKWLFETREQIHKEIFDLLTQRNEKYKEIVVLPYRQANNLDKVRDTETFFAQDRVDRQKAYCAEALARHKDFFNVVEEHVSLGVQRQSSAFWDIAPGLLDVLQKMPGSVSNLDRILIPENEYLENPSYYRFPQQYLYTLLDHAEKSTYQFIESQISLHCLLHEVKSSLLLAQCREMESKPVAAPMQSPRSAMTPRTAQYRSKEEALLTAELKQKVSIIEQQWMEALGTQLQDIRDRVKAFLEKEGVWEEMVEHAEE